MLRCKRPALFFNADSFVITFCSFCRIRNFAKTKNIFIFTITEFLIEPVRFLSYGENFCKFFELGIVFFLCPFLFTSLGRFNSLLCFCSEGFCFFRKLMYLLRERLTASKGSAIFIKKCSISIELLTKSILRKVRMRHQKHCSDWKIQCLKKASYKRVYGYQSRYLFKIVGQASQNAFFFCSYQTSFL